MIRTLADFIQVKHGGSKASFARAFGRRPQHVTQMFNPNQEWIVLDFNGQTKLCQVKTSINEE